MKIFCARRANIPSVKIGPCKRHCERQNDPGISDPLGIGWDLFGTKLYLIDTGVVTASIMWYVAIVVIVGGHVIAVYLAHTQALRLFPDQAEALRSQTPLVVLMSLWILAQPITNIRP